MCAVTQRDKDFSKLVKIAETRQEKKKNSVKRAAEGLDSMRMKIRDYQDLTREYDDDRLNSPSAPRHRGRHGSVMEGDRLLLKRLYVARPRPDKPIIDFQNLEVVHMLEKTLYTRETLVKDSAGQRIRRVAVDLALLREQCDANIWKVLESFKIYLQVSQFLPFIHKAEVQRDTLTIYTDFMECGSILNFIKAEPMSEEDSKYIASILISAIDNLHSHKVYCGTITPWSFKIDGRGVLWYDLFWNICRQFELIHFDNADSRLLQYIGRQVGSNSTRSGTGQAVRPGS